MYHCVPEHLSTQLVDLQKSDRKISGGSRCSRGGGRRPRSGGGVPTPEAVIKESTIKRGVLYSYVMQLLAICMFFLRRLNIAEFTSLNY